MASCKREVVREGEGQSEAKWRAVPAILKFGCNLSLAGVMSRYRLNEIQKKRKVVDAIEFGGKGRGGVPC